MESNIYTISQLNRTAKQLLESGLGQIWVKAEVSNLVKASSGHWYLTLKDSNAQVRCAMFRGRNQRVRFTVKDGVQVLARVQVSLYEPRGEFQLVIDSLQPEGEGILKQQFEALKLQLAAEGLFATAAKQALPERIARVGLVTSATGAAVHDMLTVLARRNPAIEVIIYPTSVQGTLAPAEIVRALSIANLRNEVDLLIVGRGGGSLEDLWAFNEEVVARAIFASRLPVVSAVGHEVDVSIADFVADVRAPTPSAAAELVSIDQQVVREQFERQREQLKRAFSTCLQQAQLRLSQLQRLLQLNHPQVKLSQQAQRIDELQLRLTRALQAKLTQQQQRLRAYTERLLLRHPSARLDQAQTTLEQLHSRLQRHIERRMQASAAQWQQTLQALELVSPLATLARGYTVTRDAQHKQLLRSCVGVSIGQRVQTQLADGVIDSEVVAVHPQAEPTDPDSPAVARRP